MKRSWGCAFSTVVCAAMITVAAAQAPPPSQSPSSRSGGAGPRFTAIGCLERSTRNPAGGGAAAAQSFTLTDPRGDKPSVYRLQGDEKLLDLHVGHTVEATGTISSASTTGGNSTSRA